PAHCFCSSFALMETNFSTGDVPPPLAPPPVIAASQPKPRKSRGWMIFAVILLVLLAFSLLGNFAQAIAHAINLRGGFDRSFKPRALREAGPRLDEVMLKDNDANNKIAVITVDGIITSHQVDQGGNSMLDIIRAQLDRAAEDKRVKAVILKVDSPGGEVM